MPALTPAEIDNKLSIGGDDVNARKVETRMTVEVQVNGRGPYHFVVDSGADTSAVGLRVARDLQLPLGTPIILNNMTDRNVVDRVKVASLAFGPSTIGNLEVPALREEDLGGDGMIGIDALVRQRLMMDFEDRLVKVEDARRPAPHYTDEIVITARLQHGQLILTQVRADRFSLDAVIDTGSEITVGNLALRNRLLSRNLNKNWTVAATGVTGKTIDLQLGNIHELRVGSITMPTCRSLLPTCRRSGCSDWRTSPHCCSERISFRRSAGSRSTSGAEGPFPAPALRICRHHDGHIANIVADEPVGQRRISVRTLGRHGKAEREEFANIAAM
jgi:hypothetical protein